MPYDKSRNAFHAMSPGAESPAQYWLTLVDGDLGAKELPAYPRALDVFIQENYAGSYPMNLARFTRTSRPPHSEHRSLIPLASW